MTFPRPARAALRAAVLLLAAGCGGPARERPSAGAPVPLLAPALDLAHCRAVPRAAGERVQRYDCAGSGPHQAVRFSAALPAGWEVGEQEVDGIAFFATRGYPGVFVHVADQLPGPRTAADSAQFWERAAEQVLGRAPGDDEVDALRRNAGGDEGRAREMLTAAQATDSALLQTASLFSAARQGRTVQREVREIRTLGGRRAGYLYDVSDREGMRWHSAVWVAVADGVFHAVVMNGPEAEWTADEALREQVLAAFVIRPAAR